MDRITSLVADIVEITFIEGEPAVQDTGIVRAGEIIDEVVRDCSLEAQFQRLQYRSERKDEWRNPGQPRTAAPRD